MRGNHRRAPPDCVVARSIPARAGEPVHDRSHVRDYRVYPRACGGTSCPGFGSATATGLSPRVRGNRFPHGQFYIRTRSIPARAGEPVHDRSHVRDYRVYPRACGGTSCPGFGSATATGLSPRVRGNRIAGRLKPEHHRSIPARAGEPAQRSASMSICWVYPRACGEPDQDRSSQDQCEVYPRACGGTPGTITQGDHDRGLSPRVRGNRRGTYRRAGPGRSIPARAGEPPPSTSTRGRGRVYPRACGEPPGRVYTREALLVYPRACGGTCTRMRMVSAWAGLSPRVRGNHVPIHLTDGDVGSIPARAGEPLRIQPITGARGVYPRACGGTAHAPAPMRYS